MWHLSCGGSAAYPGALFSLLRADSGRTVATHQAPPTSHQTAFSLPVEEHGAVQYECRYGFLLGKHWSESEPSDPVEIVLGTAVVCACVYYSILHYIH